ncbi:MAG: hypothetical protein EXR95_00515 [Gemmatimonadetes bacterium]|nr:hypothetical protein [Gemmatimonadota bacterium]
MNLTCGWAKGSRKRQLIRAKNEAQGKPKALRADRRLHPRPDGGVFVVNKNDWTIRLLVP